MAAGHVCVADPLDNVHHEMDRVVCSQCVYKSVWSPVIGEKLHPRVGACQPIHTIKLLWQ